MPSHASPSGGDVVGERGRGADLPCESEVGDLDGVAAGGEDVLGLEVAVEEAQAVHVRKALQQRKVVALYVTGCKHAEYKVTHRN